jgi:hypothetical protein
VAGFKGRRARITRTRDGFLSFGVQIDPAVKNIVENIRHMRGAVLDGLMAIAEPLTTDILMWAQDEAQWEDHPERHPNKFYKSPHTARENLEIFPTRLENGILITARHSPETIMVTGQGRVVTYGGILESEYHGPYAILQPALKEFADEFRHLSRGAAITGYKKRRPQ